VGLLGSGLRASKPGLRERVLWLASPEAAGLVLTGAALVVMAIAQVWSLSRSGIAGTSLALLIVAVAGVLRRRDGSRFRTASLCILLVLVGAVALKGVSNLTAWYGDTRTLEWRFALWRDSVPALQQFFVAGSGINTYGQVMLMYPQTDATVHAQQAHNDYLQAGIEGGLLVLIPWIIAGVLIARRILRRLRQPQDDMTWWIRVGAAAGICGIALQEVTDFSLQIPGVALLFATALAVAIHEPVTTVRRRRRESDGMPVRHDRRSVRALTAVISS
jgi:O-antigen ligase